MKPIQKFELIETIRNTIDGLPVSLKSAAKYVVDYPNDFGLDTLRTSAQKIGVSPNSLVRLAQRYDFERFDAFREPFRVALVAENEAIEGQEWIAEIEEHGEAGKQHAQAINNELHNISRSLHLMTLERVEEISNVIQASKNCYTVAVRASYALAYYFHYVGRMAVPQLQLVPKYMSAPLDELVDIGKDDVLLAITVAPYSSETIQAMRFAKERGAKIILISDSEVIGPNVKPDYFLKVSTFSTHEFACFGGAMAVLECLLSYLIKRGGEGVKTRITNYESMRDQAGAYWKPRRPRIR
ncbi:MurR/RpiR family transcriptional regulator [Amylibacter sp. SFDW26]|uniref:MurR/RpiR family transcriptional regulator n=1 Tax=Amylibacter sp. SFDW26 TaxID=2652722 RepID=UPI0012618C29|nr:MurR/RpiR family transcriptional regulator [Amylibacter sp. SFDW26]KAB7613782.1 MurR/RpiR family transcriptional regulator [Amylibacter sp. SFDW26]